MSDSRAFIAGIIIATVILSFIASAFAIMYAGTGVLDMMGQRIMNLATPIANTDASTLAYAEAAMGTVAAAGPFGGTGADGSYSCSGTCTNLNLSQIYHFTDFTVASGGLVNPAFLSGSSRGGLWILANGTCTIIGTINASGRGAPAEGGSGFGTGAGGSGLLGATGGGGGGTGTGGGGHPSAIQGEAVALDGESSMLINLRTGGAGGGSNGGGGAASATAQQAMELYKINAFRNYYLMTAFGAGGSSYTAAGGAGGGTVYLECVSWNFTGTINANGMNGTSVTSVGPRNGSGGAGASGIGQAGTSASTVASCASTYGAGGGGGGGTVIALYKTLIANSGTITVRGGNGGNLTTMPSGASTCYPGGGGASGFYHVAQWTR
jgi:hypothetical protein